jgi:putative toxin-antitoxin system antitoxin component (TIGR02293 family)
MKAQNDSDKVYKEYKNYLNDEEQNIISEPEVMYATSFNDMLAVANYDKDYAADLLDVSYKTISRYQKENKKLSPLQSEFILKTIALYNKGERVFGSHDSFTRWLKKPAFGLGNKMPDAFITTVTGINYIIDELNRIAHGDLA